MLSTIFTLALMSTSVFAVEKRQATNGEQFTSAANQLISAYIPSSALPALQSAISSAANAAKVTGDPKSIINSALLATELPEWFMSAVPSAYSSQLAALESNIDALRGTVGLPVVPIVIATTTTDNDGKTVVSTYTTSGPAATTTDIKSALTTEVIDGVTSVYSTAIGGASSIFNVVTTEVVSGVTSIFTTAISGASSVAGDISSGGSSVASKISSGGSSVASKISSGGSSVASEISSGGSSVFSEATSGASSVLSEATSGASSILNAASTALNGATSTSTGGAVPTSVAGVAAGALGLLGMMIAL